MRFAKTLRALWTRKPARRPYRAPRPGVEALEDRRVMTVIPNDPDFGVQWGLHNTGQSGGTVDADIDAPSAWDVTTGSTRTVVAVVDTGVQFSHPDLYLNIWINQDEIPAAIKANLSDTDNDGLFTFYDLNQPINQGVGKITDINLTGTIDGGDLLSVGSGWEDNVDNDANGKVDDLIGWDFKNNDNNPYDPGTAHGTAVAGVIGAMGNNGVGVAGINWKVQIMALKADWGEDIVSQALYYAVNEGAHVSNHSYGWYGDATDFSLLAPAVDYARQNGHIVVASAGNNNNNNDTNPLFPSAFAGDNILAVAATDRFDARALYPDITGGSNFGDDSVDLGAPGQSNRTTWAGGGYGNFRGTSCAAPHVAGVVALVRGQHPGWTYEQVIDHVLWAADDVASMAGITVTGGRLNAGRAVKPHLQALLSTTTAGSVTGSDGRTISFDDSDVIQLSVYKEGNAVGYRYGYYFDGSDVGLTTDDEGIDALAVLPDGDLLISTEGAFSVPGPASVISGDDSDILRFSPRRVGAASTGLGAATGGVWSLYFDGSDVGLTTDDEDIDALDILPDGDLVISTRGDVAVPGVSRTDTDVLRFHPTSLGSATSGSWSTYFDGSDVGLADDGNASDVDGLFVQRGVSPALLPKLFFSTKASQTLPGGLGTLNEDIYQFNPTQLGPTTDGSFADDLTLNGSSFGLGGFALDAIHLEWVTPQSDIGFGEGLGPVAPVAAGTGVKVSEPAPATPFLSGDDVGGAALSVALGPEEKASDFVAVVQAPSESGFALEATSWLVAEPKETPHDAGRPWATGRSADDATAAWLAAIDEAFLADIAVP